MLELLFRLCNPLIKTDVDYQFLKNIFHCNLQNITKYRKKFAQYLQSFKMIHFYTTGQFKYPLDLASIMGYPGIT